jgi:hypothetical protein
MSRFTFVTTVRRTGSVLIEMLSQMTGHFKINENMSSFAEQIEGKYELEKDDVPKDSKSNQHYK